MLKVIWLIPLFFIALGAFISCDMPGDKKGIVKTKAIFVTSEAGYKMAAKENVSFVKGNPEGVYIEVDPDSVKQTMDGIGTSFTESSAFVLAHLEKDKRRKVMENIFSRKGANFTLTRTHIGACDFCVEGKYSYLDKRGDVKLESFSVAHDKEGFSQVKYKGIKEPGYDLLPMIKEALEIKAKQNGELRIISSAWTAPSWMKDIDDWYIKGTPANNYQGTGGSLKPEYVETYADYLVRYLDEYKKEGVEIWGITPVNEPHGNNGQWESMYFSPETQNEFIKEFLGPKLRDGEYSNLNLLIYDQNRDGIEHWTDVILGDEETSEYVYGTAVHWYESTKKVYEDVFERVNAKFPDKAIIHTEGCIDDLGKDASESIGDPARFKEKNWFGNDSFWWND